MAITFQFLTATGRLMSSVHADEDAAIMHMGRTHAHEP